MSEVFSSTKERILQYIENKGYKRSEFFAETGIKRGFLDSDKLKGAVSDFYLAKILECYEDVSLLWLITGEGEMTNTKCKNETNEEINIVRESNYTYDTKPNNNNISLLQQLQNKEEEIKRLNREIGKLEYKLELYEKNQGESAKNVG